MWKRVSSRGVGLSLLLGAASVSMLHCGGDDDGSGFDDGSGNKSGNGGSGGTNIDLDGSAANGGSGNGGGAINPDAACAVEKDEATLAPVNMLIMFDRSGSMNNNDKWNDASDALVAFFQDPGTAGLRVALRFFPHDQPAAGCNNGQCSIPACSQPLVDLAPLTAAAAPGDAQEDALVSAVQGESPGGGGGTPIYAALGGSEVWATAYAQAHAAEKVVVIFVTDGAPNGCDENINNISQLAADALASDGVYTYAVGLEGSNESDMDAIAQAGGTTQGFFIGSGSSATADLLAALKAIQGSQLSCEFVVPKTSSSGQAVDPKKVNVNFTPGGGTTETLGQVPSAADCGTDGGWYYDNPTAPTKITLCPVTCATAQSDKEAKIEILLGCATQIGNPPQ